MVPVSPKAPVATEKKAARAKSLGTRAFITMSGVVIEILAMPMPPKRKVLRVRLAGCPPMRLKKWSENACLLRPPLSSLFDELPTTGRSPRCPGYDNETLISRSKFGPRKI
jgi:hypothetical protein